MSRLKVRSSDSYGHSDEERANVSHLISTVEPLLQGMEITTTRTVQEPADEIPKSSSVTASK
jgi:hypothetical protein